MCLQSEVYKKSVATSVLAIRVPLSLFISLSMPLPRLVRACVRVRVRVRLRVLACVRRRSLGYSLHAIHLLHSMVGSRKTAPFQLALPPPRDTRAH